MSKIKKLYLFLMEKIKAVLMKRTAESVDLIFMILFLSSIAIMIFGMNQPTPWVADDILKQNNIKEYCSIKDYLSHLHEFYFSWGGRIWGEFFANIFLSIPKSIFNVINTLGYLTFVSLIYINIVGRIKAFPSLLILINFLLFSCLPTFGQDILWVSGASNYMWSIMMPLLYFMFWRLYLIKKRKYMCRLPMLILLFILAIFSGWSNENVSVALIFLSIGYIQLYQKKYHYIPSFASTGAIGLVLGSLMIWLAPGNFTRFATEGHSKSFFHMLGNFFHNFGALFDFQSTLLLLVLFSLLYILGNSPQKNISANYMMAGVFSALSMSVVGHIGGRIFLGCVVFMIISVGILYNDWRESISIEKCRAILLICMLLGLHGFYIEARNEINDYAYRWNQNIEIIYQEKKRGNLDVYINPITPRNKFCAAYGLDDIQPEINNQHWLNKGVANAFGLHTIQTLYKNTY